MAKKKATTAKAKAPAEEPRDPNRIRERREERPTGGAEGATDDWRTPKGPRLAPEDVGPVEVKTVKKPTKAIQTFTAMADAKFGYPAGVYPVAKGTFFEPDFCKRLVASGQAEFVDPSELAAVEQRKEAARRRAAAAPLELSAITERYEERRLAEVAEGDLISVMPKDPNASVGPDGRVIPDRVPSAQFAEIAEE